MKVVLLDRDGTVIVDPPNERVDKIEKIELFPDTIQALKLLTDNDFAVILITNQAGIAEGLITEQDFNFINGKVLEMLAPSGVKILKTAMCPHGPDGGCDCRKPKPKMILEAAQEFNIDLSKTYIVGDHRSDVMAGINAGAKGILVKTANVNVTADEATYTAQNLLEAVEYIISH
jgi:D-glycero-D-manno-heptose 1,7-bisphosphate phosphatase